MKWVSAFSYLPLNYAIPLAKVADQTQRITFDNNLNGDKIRVRFSNRYSLRPLTLWCVSIGIVKKGQVRNATLMTHNGNSVIELKPGEECWSDELSYTVASGDKIAISTYVKDQQEIGSICMFWSKEGPQVNLSESGNYVSGEDFIDYPAENVYQVVRDDVNKGMAFYGFTGLQVLTDDRVKTVVAFGDSITHMSYMTNALYKRLYSAYPGQVSLVNRGIGGNRVLHDASYVDFIVGNGSCFGPAGVKRFEENVFGEDKADVVLVLEGINDIMHPIQFGHPEEQVMPDELIEGYKQYVEIAHKYHAKIFGATIMPCGHDDYPKDWLPIFETIRLVVNKQIRVGIGYDGYFDYDAAIRDENRPGYVKKEYHIGDGLHPNDLGGTVMADQIDLEKIMGRS